MKFFIAFITAISLLVACTEPQDDEANTAEPADDSAIESAPSEEVITQAGMPERPVRVGLDGPQMDACGTYAVVANLDPEGDNFLSVRSTPSMEADELDRLDPGTGVSVCDGDNGFSAVVYPAPGQELAECGTGSPVAAAQDYDGPCRSGWVADAYLEMIAG